MSIWQAPQRQRIPAHPFTVSDLAIFGAGMLVAMLLGIGASGILPT